MTHEIGGGSPPEEAKKMDGVWVNTVCAECGNCYVSDDPDEVTGEYIVICVGPDLSIIEILDPLKVPWRCPRGRGKE